MKHFPPRTALFAFDFTERARVAWKDLKKLAETFKVEVEVIYVSEWMGPDGVLVPRKLSARELTTFRRKLIKAVPGAARYHIAEGDPVVEILSRAKEKHFDMIVMATAGRSGLRSLAEPSVTEAVVREATIPVLTLHGKLKLSRSVLAPVNLQPYSLAGLRLAAEAAKSLRGWLTVMHVVNDPLPTPAPMKKLKRAVAALPYDIRNAVKPTITSVDGNAVRCIVNESENHGLVVLAAHRKGAIHDYFLGTTAEQVLRRSLSPVLTVPSS